MAKIDRKQRCEIRKMEQSRFQTATTLPSYNALPITRYTPTFVFHAEHLSGTELEHRKFNWSRREQHIRLESDAPAAPVEPLRFPPVGSNAKKRKKIAFLKHIVEAQICDPDVDPLQNARLIIHENQTSQDNSNTRKCVANDRVNYANA